MFKILSAGKDTGLVVRNAGHVLRVLRENGCENVEAQELQGRLIASDGSVTGVVGPWSVLASIAVRWGGDVVADAGKSANYKAEEPEKPTHRLRMWAGKAWMDLAVQGSYAEVSKEYERRRELEEEVTYCIQRIKEQEQ